MHPVCPEFPHGGTSRSPRGHSPGPCPEQAPSVPRHPAPGGCGSAPGTSRGAEDGASGGRAPPAPRRAQLPPPPGTRATAAPVGFARPLPSRAALPVPCLVSYTRSSCRSERLPEARDGRHVAARTAKDEAPACVSRQLTQPPKRPAGPVPGSSGLPPPRSPEGGTHRSDRARSGRAAPTDGRFKPQHPPPAGSAARPAQHPCGRARLLRRVYLRKQEIPAS